MIKPTKKITLKLFQPHPIQQEIIAAISDPQSFFIMAVLGRQTGKSLLINNYAIYYALNNPNAKVLIAGPSDSVIQKLYSEIKFALRGTNLVTSAKAMRGQTNIEFINDSKILFRSAGSGDNLRGESIDVLIIDEAAYIKKDIFETILLPFLTVRGKKCILATTPKGKNWIYDYYLRGMSGDKRYRSFKCSSTQNPFANKETIALAKMVMDPKRFQQEYEAEFVDSAAVFSNIDDVLTLIKQEVPFPGERYWAGLDIGLLNDRSVLSIIDSKGNLINQIIWDKIQTPKLIEDLLKINEKWRFQKLLIEVNGQGLPIFQTLQQKINNVAAFNTTSKSKAEIIEDLIYSFNMINFKAIDDVDLRIELEGFIGSQDTAASIKYMAQSGIHDDRVLSLAIARHCYKIHRGAGTLNYIGVKFK